MEGVSKCIPSFFMTKPRLSQAEALLLERLSQNKLEMASVVSFQIEVIWIFLLEFNL